MNKALKFAINAGVNDLSKTLSRKMGKTFSKPMQVSICPTQRCNAKCLMCHCWKEKKDYISKEDITNFIEDLYQWLGNDFFVQIAGGEPLIYKGIFDIFKYCSSRNITTKITTNGYGLNKKVCDKIIESGLPYISVSIDSHIPKVHDEFRGRKDTFKNAMEGIKYLKENSDIAIGISSIIMKDNINHLKEFAAFLQELNVDRVLFQPMRDYYNPIDKWKEYMYWINDHKALDEGINYLIDTKLADPKFLNTLQDFEIIRNYFKDPLSIVNKRKCYIGLEQLFVDDKGDISLCDAYSSIGNIKNRDIKKLWYAQKSEAERKKMVNCRLPCTSNCKKELSLKDKAKKFIKLQQAGIFK